MKLADISHGPDWIIWLGFAILTAMSILLISGRGSWLISGYNTASEEEKTKYDEKKLCKTTGIGLGVIAVLVLVMGLLENVLPASFAGIALGIILVDCLLTIVVSNTICKNE